MGDCRVDSGYRLFSWFMVRSIELVHENLLPNGVEYT